MAVFSKFVITGLLVSLLCACGGGSSTSGDGIVPGGVNSDSVSGLWTGTYTAAGGELQFLSTALVTSDGQVAIDLGNGVKFMGSSSGGAANIAIIGNESAASTAVVSMLGNVNPGQSFSASVTQGAWMINSGAVFNYAYDSAYDRASSLERIAANWTGQYTLYGISQNWDITISADGSLVGTSGPEFSLNGQVSLIDASKNEYRIAMDIIGTANSYINGSYTGIATIIDGAATDDTLVLFLEGDQQYHVVGSIVVGRN